METSGLIIGLCSANARRRYFVMTSLNLELALRHVLMSPLYKHNSSKLKYQRLLRFSLYQCRSRNPFHSQYHGCWWPVFCITRLQSAIWYWPRQIYIYICSWFICEGTYFRIFFVSLVTDRVRSLNDVLQYSKTWHSTAAINTLRYNFFVGNIKIYLKIIFLYIDMTPVIQICPYARQAVRHLLSLFWGIKCYNRAEFY